MNCIIPVSVREVKMENGMIFPQSIIWGDGRIFNVSKVLFFSPAPAHEFEGIRYTVIIGSTEKYIYRANHNWYVMAPDGGDMGEKAHYL